MTSRERILAALDGQPADRVPLTIWCFGVAPAEPLCWQKEGQPLRHWYSMRLEHIHTLPAPWEMDDEFRRAKAWQSLGIDDLLEISVPWSCDPEVTWQDTVIPSGGNGGDARYPVMVRQYHTPAGPLRHAVRKTSDEGNGWPIQPDHVPLIEDYNIPRAVEHAVSSPTDVAAVEHLFAPPDTEARRCFAERMVRMKAFADAEGFPVQAWSAFGMDGVVWLTGTEGAVMMAMDAPEAFGRLVDTIAATDHARTELAATTDGIDLVCQRGWYSSTDFWSPALFDRYVYPHVAELAALVHRHGKKFGYVMTTGVDRLGPRLADAGVDLLYFVDPTLDSISLARAAELFGDRMTVAGGINSATLACGEPSRIRDEVRRAVDAMGPTNRFILHPVDAIFPDTPWAGVERMIEAWGESN